MGMAEYIEKEAAKRAFFKGNEFVYYGTDVHDRLDELPAVDAVERAVYEQVAWERDMAIEQLKAIGKGFGEKMDDVVEVVRCRKCKHWETDWPPSGFDPANPRYFCSVNDIFPTGDWFCKDGERKEYSLYESLKRGLEEAIAYENGEIELRTEIREEGDT